MAGITRIGRGAGPGEPGTPARPVSGTPETRLWNEFSDPSGQFFCGLWSSAVGSWEVSYSEAEFCVILDGHVRLESGGVTEEFRAGDAFVIPSGFAGVWHTVAPVRKLYAVFEPR